MTAGTDSRPSLAVAPVPPGSPAATRHPRRAWRDPRLAVGVALVALSVVLGARLFAAADDTVSVWAARTGLDPSRPVAPGDLVRRQVRFDSQQQADRYLRAGEPLPAGSTLRRPVGAGELLPRAALAGTGGGPALTEVPLSVAEEAVPATVRVGSVVDVWVTPDPDGPAAEQAGQAGQAGPGRATLVFDDVRVLATPSSATALGPSATRQVIVGLDRHAAAGLPEALARLSGGSVVLTRRH